MRLIASLEHYLATESGDTLYGKHSGLLADALGHGGLALVEVTIGLPSGGLRGGGGACGENSCS
jgi:hypothetical protein